MAKLQGHAIKISWLGADHTYVTSSDGGKWGCWGRSNGGRAVCSGTGSSKRANCLSQSSSHAGIIYGVTGVCHQTANRILLPARVVVSHAKGYWASVLMYGTFGTHGVAPLIEWEVRKARCRKVSGDLGVQKTAAVRRVAARLAKAAKVPKPEAGIRTYVDKVNAIYVKETGKKKLAALTVDEKIDIHAQELELMVDFKLGAAKTKKKVKTLQKLQTDLLKKKHRFDNALIGKDISTAQYARQVNGMLGKFMKGSGAHLGKAEHTQLFGMAPDTVFQLVDPRILARYHKE